MGQIHSKSETGQQGKQRKKEEKDECLDLFTFFL